MVLPKYYEGIIKHQAQSLKSIFSLLSWCNWIKVFKMFCNIWSLLEHCHKSSASKNSFSLFSHFFISHEDFFPSCSIPILDLEPIVGGYMPAHVGWQWWSNVREHPAQWEQPTASAACSSRHLSVLWDLPALHSASQNWVSGLCLLGDSDREWDTAKDESLQDTLQTGGCVLTNFCFHLLIFQGSVCAIFFLTFVWCNWGTDHSQGLIHAGWIAWSITTT